MGYAAVYAKSLYPFVMYLLRRIFKIDRQLNAVQKI